jgi:hypothetical protein
MTAKVAILAYGSVIDDPREEIRAATIGMLDCTTPFNIEYARQSRTRKGAPTLVPVEEGGAQVSAKLILLNVTAKDAGSGSGLRTSRRLPPKGLRRSYRLERPTQRPRA